MDEFYSTTARLAWATTTRTRMESPLVNSYKRPFIARRLLETFLGGLRLFASRDVPVYVYILQITLFSVIPLLSTLFVLLEHHGTITLHRAVYTSALLKFLYAFVLQFFAYFLRMQKSKAGEVEETNFATDEEVLQFDSPFGPLTWAFLVREKRLKVNILLHSLLAGVVGGSVVYYIRPSSTIHLNVPWMTCVVFTVLGVITEAAGLWPLIGGAPPEPATFHPLSWDLSAVSRPIHMLFCVLIHLAASYYPYTWLLVVDGFCHLIFATSTVLWVLGVLPPIDAFLLWLLEQWLVIALGGSPMASSIRLVPHVILGTLTLLTAAVSQSFPLLMVFAACRGFLFSIDFAWLVSSLLSHHVKILSGISGKYEETRPVEGKPSLRRITCCRELGLYVPLLLAVTAMSFGAHLPHHDWYEDVISIVEARNASVEEVQELQYPLTPSLFGEPARNIVGVFLVIITISMLVVNEVQKVYILGILRNPLFTHKKDMQKSIFLYVYTQFLQIGCPLVSLIYIHQVVSVELHLHMSSKPNSFDRLLLTIPLLRIFRLIWQFPHASFLHLSVFFIIEVLYQHSSIPLGSWGTFTPASRIFLVSLAHLFGTRLIQRICTVLLFLITSVTEKKQHIAITFFLVGFNIAILPLLLGLLILSAVLSAPLLPLFTLPIFFLGFPRPLRFWSYPVGRSSNSCEDSVYYEQLTPHVIFALHNLAQSGSLGMVEPGEHFLLRWEDRFLWIQVLECGFTYQYYSVKGLELQETSCHTTEASRVDANFSCAFDDHTGIKSGVMSSTFNPHAFHTLTPLSQVNVIGYSDTRNVLTGVIDSPDTLKFVNDYFHKALIYVVLDFIVKKSGLSAGIDRDQQSQKKVTSASNSKSQVMIKNLPKVARTAQYHFEEGLSQSKIDSEGDGKEPVPSMGSHISHSSRHSQSGRGSRMAWVEDPRLHDTLPALSFGDSRQASWDDDEDPLDNSNRHLKRSSSASYAEEVMNVKNKDKNKTTLPPIRSKAQEYVASLEDLVEADTRLSLMPGIMYDSSSSDDEYASMTNHPSGNSVHHKHRHKTSARINLRVLAQRELQTPVYSTPLSAALAPSPSWFLELPFDLEVIDEVQDAFPHAWFKFLLNHFGRKYVDSQNHSAQSSKSLRGSKGSGPSSSIRSSDKEDQIQKMQYDEALEESYRLLIGTCHLIVLGSDTLPPSPSQIHKTYAGEIPWSMALDWLMKKNLLYDLVLKAYRIGLKLSLDHTLIGAMTGWAELQAAMEDYSDNWYLGPDNRVNEAPPTSPLSSSAPESELRELIQPKSWREAVIQEMPNLFSLGYNPVKGVYTSHMLSLGAAEVAVGRLGCETVRALWASLVTELLYLTNDDDERYSIQAQPSFLRNLTIQAADPPLGYPIYSSSPLRLAVTWLNATYQQLPDVPDDDKRDKDQ